MLLAVPTTTPLNLAPAVAVTQGTARLHQEPASVIPLSLRPLRTTIESRQTMQQVVVGGHLKPLLLPWGPLPCWLPTQAAQQE